MTVSLCRVTQLTRTLSFAPIKFIAQTVAYLRRVLRVCICETSHYWIFWRILYLLFSNASCPLTWHSRFKFKCYVNLRFSRLKDNKTITEFLCKMLHIKCLKTFGGGRTSVLKLTWLSHNVRPGFTIGWGVACTFLGRFQEIPELGRNRREWKGNSKER